MNSESEKHDNGKESADEIMRIMLNNDIVDRKSEIEENSKLLDALFSNINANAVSDYKFDMDELAKWKLMNNELHQIDYYRPLQTHRKLLKGPIFLIKRIIRKLAKYLIEPIVLEQNLLNSSVTASINALYNNSLVSQIFMDSAMEERTRYIRNTERIIHSLKSLNCGLGAVIDEQKRLDDSIKNNFSYIMSQIEEQARKLSDIIENNKVEVTDINSFKEHAHAEIRRIDQNAKYVSETVRGEIDEIKCIANEANAEIDNEITELKRIVYDANEANEIMNSDITELKRATNEVHKEISSVTAEFKQIINEANAVNKEISKDVAELRHIAGETQDANDAMSKEMTALKLNSIDANKAAEIMSNEITDLKRVSVEVSEANKEKETINKEFHEIINFVNERNETLSRELGEVKTVIEKDKHSLSELKAEFGGLYKYLDQSELNILRAIKDSVLSDDVVVSNRDLSDINEPAKSTFITASGNSDHDNHQDYADIDYFEFENHFRGSRRSIMAAQEKYLSYYKNMSLVVDLGCGRGEFLEILRKNNIKGVGVDRYEEFVDYCRLKGLDVVKADILDYLSDSFDASIDGLFISQVVEHLDTGKLVGLCKSAYEKLKTGGIIIIETPNPVSLYTYVSTFYLDPTHNKFVHPLALKFFLDKSGFSKVDIIYTEWSKVNYRLPLLEGANISNLTEFNEGINRLSDIMFGSLDYAIVAQK